MSKGRSAPRRRYSSSSVLHSVFRAALLAGVAAALALQGAAAQEPAPLPEGPPEAEGPQSDGSTPEQGGSSSGTQQQAIDPHYLLEFLPASLNGVPRADTRTGLEKGAPVAAAVYAGGGTRREVSIRQLYGDSASEGSAPADAVANDTAADDDGAESLPRVSGSDGESYQLVRRGRGGNSAARGGSYAIRPQERFLVTVSGSVSGPEQAQTLLEEVDIAGLLAFEPPSDGYETVELYADVIPTSVRYPASWILVDAGRSGGFARLLLLMSEPIEPAELTEEPASLFLDRRIAATIGVLPEQESFSTRDYMIRTPSLLPYRFRQSRPTIRPERATEYGEEAGFAAFRAIDFNGNAVDIRELVYRPGDRWVQLHLLVPERVEFGTESVFRELANGISVTLP